MKRIHALHLTPGHMFGGVETVLVTLARHRDASPELESHFGVSFPGRLEDELKSAGAVVHRIGGPQSKREPLRLLKANRRLSQLLSERQTDVIVMHGVWPHVAFGLTARLRGIPIVHWAHRAPFEIGLVDRVADFITPDLVITNSHHTQKSLGRLFAGVPVRLVRCPVDAPVPDPEARAAIRAETGTASRTTVIACAARLEPWKGHRLLLQSVARVRDVPDWELWVIGGAQRSEEAEYLAELHHLCASLGIVDRVRFLGQRADVPGLLAAADLYCQPNVGAEPFGIAFVEALYARLPVVTTAMGGALEIVDETCGMLTGPTDSAVAGALRTLLVDPDARARLSRGGFDRAHALCEPGARVRELAAALGEIRRPSLPPPP